MKLSVLKATFAICLALGFMSVATAQEGHPLKGSWIGVWESNQALGEFVLIVMDWDGEEVTGVVNPGTDDIEIDNVTLNPDDWTVMIEAGDYVVEGAIENLELPSRAIVGSWENGNNNGHFEVVRQ